MTSKVINVNEDGLTFDDGSSLTSDHDQDCCEQHYLCFKDLSLKDFEGLEFDLTGETFFEKVEDYGIRLIPLNGHPVSVPGYGYNNGYYSHNLELVVKNKEGSIKTFDISECQDIKD